MDSTQQPLSASLAIVPRQDCLLHLYPPSTNHQWASALDKIPGEGIRARAWFAMGKVSPTKLNGDCEEIANPSTAYGRRRRNWIDAHGSVPDRQVVDASCGNRHCIALPHAYLRPRVEQPRKYRKIAERVHRLKIGQHFDVQGVGTDERSRNRFRCGLYAAAGLDKVSARAAGRECARHESREMV